MTKPTLKGLLGGAATGALSVPIFVTIMHFSQYLTGKEFENYSLKNRFACGYTIRPDANVRKYDVISVGKDGTTVRLPKRYPDSLENEGVATILLVLFGSAIGAAIASSRENTK